MSAEDASQVEEYAIDGPKRGLVNKENAFRICHDYTVNNIS